MNLPKEAVPETIDTNLIVELEGWLGYADKGKELMNFIYITQVNEEAKRWRQNFVQLFYSRGGKFLCLPFLATVDLASRL